MKIGFPSGLMFLLLAGTAGANWDPNAWSGIYHTFYMDGTNEVYIAPVMRTNAVAAMDERMAVIGDSYTPPSGWWSSHRSYLTSMKAKIKTSCTQFVDMSQASGGTFDDYFAANPSATDFPMYTPTGLCAYVGAPTNWLDSTPYTALNEPQTTNGWLLLDDVLNALVWVSQTATVDVANRITTSYTSEATSGDSNSGFDESYDLVNKQVSCVVTVDSTDTLGTVPPVALVSTSLALPTLTPGTPSSASVGGFEAGIVGAMDIEWWGFTRSRYGHYVEEGFFSACSSCGDPLDILTVYSNTNLYESESHRYVSYAGLSEWTTTGSYEYVSSLYTGAVVDVYALVLPSDPSDQFDDVSSSGLSLYDYIAYEPSLNDISVLANCTDKYSYDYSTHSYLDYFSTNFTVSVDTWRVMTNYTGFLTPAKKQTVEVPASGVYPGHEVLLAHPGLDTLLVELGSASVASSNEFFSESWIDTQYCVDDPCPTDIGGTWDRTVQYRNSYQGSGVAAWSAYDDVAGSNWKYTEVQELMLVKYNATTNGFVYK